MSSNVLNKNGFWNPTKGSMTIGKIVDEISRFMDEDRKSFYEIIVGSDSSIKHVDNKRKCSFVTVIVVHRVGYGAKYFWKRDQVAKAPVLREKIYSETVRSLETAGDILPVIAKNISSKNYNFEIHIDVGEVGKTREMISEVVGMVTGSGYVVKIKPESWGASCVADRYT